MEKRLQSVLLPQGLRLLGAAADENHHVKGLDDGVQHGGGEIAAQTNAEYLALQQTYGVRQKAAIEKNVGRLLIKRPEMPVVIMTDNMIDVGRNDVPKALAAERGDEPQCFFEVVVIDV